MKIINKIPNQTLGFVYRNGVLFQPFTVIYEDETQSVEFHEVMDENENNGIVETGTITDTES